MSSMAPRGPLPARVYWIRRAVVVAVALLLVLVVGKLLAGGSDAREEEPTAQSSGAVQLSGTEPDPTVGDIDTTESARGKKRLPLAEPTGPCDPEKVTVTPVGGSRANDGKVGMVLAVGTSEEACTFTFSPESVVVKIVSGSDPIWSSQQCSVLPTAEIVPRAAKAAKVSFIWNGHRSDEDCSPTAAWAYPGSYHAIAATLGGEPTDTQFELTRPPGVVITKTATPKAAPTASSTTAPKPTTKSTTEAGDPREP